MEAETAIHLEDGWLSIGMEITKPLHQKSLEIHPFPSIHLEDAWGIQEESFTPQVVDFLHRNHLRFGKKKRFHYPKFKWEEFELSKQLITPFGCDALSHDKHIPWIFLWCGRKTRGIEFNGRSGGRSRRSWEINFDRRIWRVNSHCFPYGRGVVIKPISKVLHRYLLISFPEKKRRLWKNFTRICVGRGWSWGVQRYRIVGCLKVCCDPTRGISHGISNQFLGLSSR